MKKIIKPLLVVIVLFTTSCGKTEDIIEFIPNAKVRVENLGEEDFSDLKVIYGDQEKEFGDILNGQTSEYSNLFVSNNTQSLSLSLTIQGQFFTFDSVENSEILKNGNSYTIEIVVNDFATPIQFISVILAED
jgi:hypothetical protein